MSVVETVGRLQFATAFRLHSALSVTGSGLQSILRYYIALEALTRLLSLA